MTQTSYIALNYLALGPEEPFEFRAFRRRMSASEPSTTGQRRLRHELASADTHAKAFGRYEVSLLPKEGLQEVRLGAWTNAQITLDAIFQALIARIIASKLSPQVEFSPKSWKREAAFVLKDHGDGVREVMWVRPFDLRSVGRFGLLLNFAIRVAPTSQIETRRLHELSLTQRNGRTNENYYLDQFRKISEFLQRYHHTLSPLALHDGTSLELANTLSVAPSFRLDRRTYIFSDGQRSDNQFFGLRDYGPFGHAERNTRLAFLFHPSDRANSQDLFRALRGDTFRTFPGMEKLFRTVIDRTNVVGLEVQNFSNAQLDLACRKLKKDHPDNRVLPIALVPFSKHVSDDVTLDYYRAKHAILSNGLASQFVDRTKTMGDREALKWSISNIALAVFAKMGGVPWRVVPSTDRCLIVGIGQAHRWSGEKIERYVAYSVLTDSSGKYEALKVLGDSSDHSKYIASLKDNLRTLLISHQNSYKSFVIHATFSLRKEDIAAIKEILDEVRSADRDFFVLKFNDRHDFFGFSPSHNSRVPYEGTVVQLSKHQFIVWFSGLGAADSRAPRKPERPIHVDVLYPVEATELSVLKRLLQDSMNIAGANWRGFNAKSMPISVYYAKLIADHYAHFRQAGLEDINMDEIHPWFL